LKFIWNYLTLWVFFWKKKLDGPIKLTRPFPTHRPVWPMVLGKVAVIPSQNQLVLTTLSNRSTRLNPSRPNPLDRLVRIDPTRSDPTLTHYGVSMGRVGFGSGHHYFIIFLDPTRPDLFKFESKNLDPYPTRLDPCKIIKYLLIIFR
jgi:hypothetical protein